MGFFSRLFRRQKPEEEEVVEAPRRETPARVQPPPPPPAGPAEELEPSLYAGDLVAGLVREVKQRGSACTAPAERQFYSALLRALTNGSLPLPAIPDAVLKIQKVIDAPNCDVSEIVRVIAADPTVATKVVGVANSTLYRGQIPTSSLKNAVIRIGLNETRNLVLAILSKSKLFRVPGFETEAAALYQHAIVSALATQRIAVKLGTDRDEAFLAGLVHNIGSVVLLTMASEIFRSSRGASAVSADAIKAAAEALHPAIGALVARTWHLSPVIVSAVLHHHEPEAAPPEAAVLAATIRTADQIADRIVAESSGGSTDELEVTSQDILMTRSSFESLSSHL